MHRLPLIAALCATLAVTACKSELDDKPSATVKDPKAKAEGDTKDAAKDATKDGDTKQTAVTASTLPLDTAASTVGFVGAKVTADHEGSFGTVAGSLTMEGDAATKLEITVQVGSLKIEPPDLQGHLLSPDFFDAAKFTEAKFVSSAITAKAGEGGATHEIEGDLTLHGVTKTIAFPATVEVSPAAASGKAEFKINRKDFGITYPGMQDDLIKDDVLLKLNLAFKRA